MSSTVTYYFDSYDSSSGGDYWNYNPQHMVDGSEDTFAHQLNTDDVQLCLSNTCVAGTDLGVITKVELRALGAVYGPLYPRVVTLRPVFGGTNDGSDYAHTFSNVRPGTWGDWKNITNDSAISGWKWDDVIELDCDVECDNVMLIVYVYKVEMKVTYTPYLSPYTESPGDALTPYTETPGNGLTPVS